CRFTRNGRRIRLSHRNTLALLRSLHLRLTLQRRSLLTYRLLLVQLGDTNGLLTLRLLDLRLLGQSGELLSNRPLLGQLGDAHRALTFGTCKPDLTLLHRLRNGHALLTLRNRHAHLSELLLLGNVSACLL